MKLCCVYRVLGTALAIGLDQAAYAQGQGQSAAPLTLQEVDRRVRLLEFQVKSMQERVAYRSATLDCNSGKYDEFLFKTGTLTFFAACTKIEPYLEGHRITVSIGNPHSFNFSNVKGILNYGKDWPDSFEKNTEVSVTDSIRGGSWNIISIIVNPSKAEEMRYLSLQLEATTAGSIR